MKKLTKMQQKVYDYIAQFMTKWGYPPSVRELSLIHIYGQRILSRNGLVDLLNDNMTAVGLYPIIHLKGEDIEIAFTHTGQYGERCV